MNQSWPVGFETDICKSFSQLPTYGSKHKNPAGGFAGIPRLLGVDSFRTRDLESRKQQSWQVEFDAPML